MHALNCVSFELNSLLVTAQQCKYTIFRPAGEHHTVWPLHQSCLPLRPSAIPPSSHPPPLDVGVIECEVRHAHAEPRREGGEGVEEAVCRVLEQAGGALHRALEELLRAARERGRGRGRGKETGTRRNVGAQLGSKSCTHYCCWSGSGTQATKKRNTLLLSGTQASSFSLFIYILLVAHKLCVTMGAKPTSELFPMQGLQREQENASGCE